MAASRKKGATRKPRKSAGMAARRTALVVLRKGNAIDQARVLDKEFRIEIEELGQLKVPTKLIKTIILKNEPLFPLDVIRMLKGNEISGVISTDPVHIDSEEAGGKIDIPLAKILSIIFSESSRRREDRQPDSH